MKFVDCAAPTRLAAAVLLLERPGRRIIEKFAQLQGARCYIERAVGDRRVYWEGHTVFSVGDLTVTSEQLEDVMESRGDVVLPEPYPRNIDFFMSARVQRPDPVRVVKVKRGGLVSVAQLSKDQGWDVREVRAILRKEIDKPAQGWCWKESDVPGLVKMVAKKLRGK